MRLILLFFLQNQPKLESIFLITRVFLLLNKGYKNLYSFPYPLFLAQ